jgi:membrane-associated phospholipid phosphatase
MTSAGTIASRPTVPLRPSPSGRTPGGVPRVLGGLVLAVAGAVVVVVSWLLFVVSDRGRHLDHSVMLSVEHRFSSVYGEILGVLHLVNVLSVGVVVLAIAGLALARRRPGVAAAGVALVVVTQVLAQGLKATLPSEGATENSLPSGHVTVITSLVIATVLALPAALRWIAGLVGVLAVAGASVAVMAVGWHRPGDVVAAFGVVAAVGGVLWIVDGVRRELPRRR